MSKKFFITLPIYYANDKIHIGHSYSSLIGDVLARSKRMLGYDVKFSVGTDENSQKIVLKAEELGRDVMDFLDETSAGHKRTRDELQISYTDFIRTTEPRHKEFVTKILNQAYQKGDFYENMYEGLYCIGCEGFKKESDIVISDGNHGMTKGEQICPLHPNAHLSKLQEKNRFFKLKNYENYLKNLYKTRPDFIQPDHRFNEIKSFVEQGLEDFSISRQGVTLGIPLPFDEDQITYVWYDALLNYNTICQNGDEDFWPADVQVMGKDITRFHAIYYPAMLESVGLPAPKQQLINGFLTADGQKISKSLGNAIDPLELIKDYDRDALVMYLLYDLKIGSDGDFSWKRFDEMYGSMLIGGWGNLVARVSKLAAKNNITKITSDAITSRLTQYVSDTQSQNEQHNELLETFINKSVSEVLEIYLKKLDLQQLLRDRYSLVQGANKYLNDAEPWKKLGNEETKQSGLDDLVFMLYLIKNLAILIAPYLINGSKKVVEILGIKELEQLHTDTTMPEHKIQELFDIVDTTVSLDPQIIYSKPEKDATDTKNPVGA